MKKTIDTATQTVTFTFTDLEPVTLAMRDVSPANATYAMLHGFAARIGDNAAIAKTAENGFTVTEEMRRAEVENMVKFYANAENTDWNMRVAAGPRKAPQSPAIMALATALGMTYEQCQAKLANDAIAEMAKMGGE